MHLYSYLSVPSARTAESGFTFSACADSPSAKRRLSAKDSVWVTISQTDEHISHLGAETTPFYACLFV